MAPHLARPMIGAVEPDALLGALVADVPSRADVLDDLAIDYAVGGERSVADAAGAIGVPVADLVAAIAEHDGAVARAADWSRVPPTRIVDQLDREHTTYLAQLYLPAQASLERIALQHVADEPHLAALLDRLSALEAVLVAHFDGEEHGLFAACRALDSERADAEQEALACVAALGDDHRVIAAELRALVEGAAEVTLERGADPSWDATAGALSELERAFRRHAHCESYILPRSIALANAAALG